MNDVTFLEAARKLAERMIKEGGAAPADRLTFAFRLATARRPRPAELRVLSESLARHRDVYQTDPQAAAAFLGQGESPRDTALDPGELAAYSAVAGLILNLDETVTKE
jgi:hypothetical protein